MLPARPPARQVQLAESKRPWVRFEERRKLYEEDKKVLRCAAGGTGADDFVSACVSNAVPGGARTLSGTHAQPATHQPAQLGPPAPAPQRRDEARQQLQQLEERQEADEGPLAEREAALKRLQVRLPQRICRRSL